MRSLTAGTMTIAILAILVGLVGAYAIRTMLIPPPPAAAPAPPPPINVPLASTDLPKGRVIKVGDIGLISMTPEQLRNSGFPLDVTMLNSQQIIGRRVKEPITQGSPFLTTSFYLEGTGPSITDNLKPGYRAVSIPVQADQRGLVTPGAYVDVLFLTKPSEDVPEMTVTFLQGVEVLQAEGSTAALAVTFNDARRLETVQGRGTFSLVPRATADQVAFNDVNDRLTFNDVLGIKPPPPPPRPFATVIYRGARPSLNLFPPGGPVAAATPRDDLGLFPIEPAPSASDRSGGAAAAPSSRSGTGAAPAASPTYP